MRVKVWDLPTRIFHWLLAVAVAGSLATALLGGNLMDWHGRIGLFVVGLLAFRLVWGLVGSTYARFSDFLPTPGRVRAYLRGEWQGLGHNPLGALSVFALLGLMLWQTSTGLFSNDDIAFEGPLYDLLEKSTSDQLTSWHRQGLWIIVGLVSLHIAAVLFYLVVRRKNLIHPMITGWKPDPQAGHEAAAGGGGWLLFFALAAAVLAVWVAAGGLLPPAPPPPPTPVPAW